MRNASVLSLALTLALPDSSRFSPLRLQSSVREYCALSFHQILALSSAILPFLPLSPPHSDASLEFKLGGADLFGLTL